MSSILMIAAFIVTVPVLVAASYGFTVARKMAGKILCASIVLALFSVAYFSIGGDVCMEKRAVCEAAAR